MPEKSVVSKLLWTAGHPVHADLFDCVNVIHRFQAVGGLVGEPMGCFQFFRRIAALGSSVRSLYMDNAFVCDGQVTVVVFNLCCHVQKGGIHLHATDDTVRSPDSGIWFCILHNVPQGPQRSRDE